MLLEVLKISLNIRSKTALGGFAKIVNYKAFVHVENVLLRNVYDWIYSRIIIHCFTDAHTSHVRFTHWMYASISTVHCLQHLRQS